MKQNRTIAWILAGMVAFSAIPAGAQITTDTMKMQKAVEYAHAGIILALPTGFTISPQLYGEFQVMLASRIEGMQATQSVTLAAYPVNGKSTPEQVLERLQRPLKDSLSVQRLKVIKTVPFPVVGLHGKAVHMTYTFRGIKTVTLSACFIRDVASIVPATAPAGETQPASQRLAYVLTLEVARSHQTTMLKTFEAIARTIMLTSIRRPINLPMDFDGPYLRDFPRGYAVRLPVGWVSGQNNLGVYMQQTDYLLGGVPCPSVQVVSNRVDPSLTAQVCGQKAIEYMKKQGAKVKILSKGPAKLAKRDGFQFVLRKTQPPTTQPAQAAMNDTTTLEVHRLLCVPPNEEEYEEHARSYALIVVGRDVTVEKLTNLADQLAKQFIVVTAREE